VLGHLELVAGVFEFFDQLAEVVAQGGGFAGEVLTFENAPLLEDGHHHVVEVDARVVHPADGDDDGLATERRHGVPGHLEVAQHPVQRRHRLVGGDVQTGGRDVAVEDHVQVLVGGDARQQLIGDRIVAGLAGVAVRDAGRELLERHVHHRVEQALGEQVALLVLAGREATGDLLHAGDLEVHRIDGAGHHQVVAQSDAVAVLLGGPPVDPVAPGTVHAEVHRDLAVVRRQVVLGQEVLHHRGLRHLGELRLAGLPVLAAEGVPVLAFLPRDVIVRIPVLAHGHVPVDLLFDHGLELMKKLQVGQVLRHASSGYLYLLVAVNISVYLSTIQVPPAGVSRTPPTCDV